MQTLKLFLAALVLLPAVAYAEVMIEDADGDGVYSVEEVTAAYPSVTAELFVEMDANEDGAIDAEELAAAVAAGLIAG